MKIFILALSFLFFFLFGLLVKQIVGGPTYGDFPITVNIEVSDREVLIYEAYSGQLLFEYSSKDKEEYRIFVEIVAEAEYVINRILEEGYFNHG